MEVGGLIIACLVVSIIVIVMGWCDREDRLKKVNYLFQEPDYNSNLDGYINTNRATDLDIPEFKTKDGVIDHSKLYKFIDRDGNWYLVKKCSEDESTYFNNVYKSKETGKYYLRETDDSYYLFDRDKMRFFGKVVFILKN